ncbi:hypothetical protein MKX08_007042 [Trichoderma sp. CBMAI-0020]|nr:hypothetical protein MKX08_007042 [Trichoderma sp. CBMAI-0020]
MQIKNVLTGLVGLAVLADAASIERRSPFGRALERRQRGQNGNNGGNQGNQGNNQGNQGNNNQGGNANNGGGSVTLDSNLIQTGSQQDGNNPGGEGQVASATDNENFINFCQGKTLTNGAQVKTGSCNGIPMGNIPSVNNMVSSLFVNPQNGDNIASSQTFDIQVQMINFAPGSFTNATNTYYSAPQDVDGNGNIIGHTHVTVQNMGDSQTPSQPLDPQSFVFFKGINDAGNGNGLLSATVDGGLPAGNYRLCSMSAAANHQPVLMPVAQRGAQDDCVRFTVSDNGNGGNNGGNNANNGNGNNANNGNGNAGTNNAGAGNNNGQAGQNGQNGQGQNNGQTGQAGQNGQGQNGAGSTNNAGTGSVQTGDNNNNGQAGQTGQNGQGQNNGQAGQTGQNGQTGQAGQAGQAGAGQGGRRGGRGGRKGGKGANAQAATSVAAGNAAAATGAPAASSAAAVSNAASGAGGATSATALGGIAAPPVTQSGNGDRPFEVQGNTFTTKSAAAQRACDIQNNQCADAVNSKSVSGVSVGDCNNQIAACVAALSASS